VKSWRVILSVAVIFGAGMVTGGLLTRSHLRPATPATAPTAAPGGPPGSGIWRVSRAQFVEKMHRQLDLTPDQCAQVDKIMKASHDRMAKLWEPIAPQANEETCHVREQIQAILTPEQKTKFEDVIKPRKGHENNKDTARREKTSGEREKNVKECWCRALDFELRDILP
jgi:Spy/CpxP family protein refolding chaperone